MRGIALRALLLASAAAGLWGCVTLPHSISLPAVDVAASGETEPVGTANTDAADDPAIWRNPADPSASLIVGTDKRAGIHVYRLDGRAVGFASAGEINNVDLRDEVAWQARRIVLVGASNRNSLTQPRLSLFALDTRSGALEPLAELPVPGADGEAYGFCLGRIGNDPMPRAYLVTKAGRIDEVRIHADTGAPVRLERTRSFTLRTQSEGCVVDDRTGLLYVGEEDVGVWRIDLNQPAPAPVVFASVGASQGLVADVEGLALAPEGERGGLLVVSSQGDNAYALLDLDTAELRGRFRINGGPIGGTSETDGIELMLGDFGPRYREGLFVAQDGDNTPRPQNFKLVSWAEVRTALAAPPSAAAR